MVRFDDKHEDEAQEKQEQSSAPSSWDRPLLLAGLGLVLMLGGYVALNYVLAARLAIFAGLILFAGAGVLMYRSSPSTREIEEREER